MSAHLTEEEQVENLKRLWNQYGTPLLVGITVALLGLYGYRFYQNYQAKITGEASALYQSLVTTNQTEQKNSEKSLSIASQLKQNYERTPYSVLASMIVAANYVNSNALDKAKTELAWAMQHAKDEGLRALATVRLARIHLAENNNSEALTLVDSLQAEHFSALVEQAKGDIYLALGKKEKAKESYIAANNKLDASNQYKIFLQMKIDDLSQAKVVKGATT